MQTHHIHRKGKPRFLSVILLVLVAVSGCKTNTGTTSTAEKEKPFQTLVEQGDALLNNKEYEAARETYRKAAEIPQKYSAIYYKLLYSYAKQLSDFIPKESKAIYEGEGAVNMPQILNMHKYIRTGFDEYGAAHPSYNNAVYAWEYTKDSLNKKALYAHYQYISCKDNTLTKTDADGRKTVIYKGNGYGNIWIIQDRLFLYRNNSKEKQEKELFSINMQGKDLHAYGNYEVNAVNGNQLILSDSQGTKLYVMNTVTENIQQLETDALFLYADGDIVYFTAHPEDTREHIMLYSIKTDGTNRHQLADIQKEILQLPISISSPLYINCVQTIQDTVYFSYGIYAGSIAAYQGGQLASVKTDGSDFKLLDGAPVNFTVYDNGNIMDGGKLNQPFLDANGNVWLYTHNKKIKPLTNGEEYTRQSTDTSLTDIQNVDVQGDYVYYTVNQSIVDKSVSIGYRTGYRLQSSTYYRKNMKTGKIDQLYEISI